MDSVTTIRLATDAFLAASMIVCAVRMLKSSASAFHVKRIQELEGNVRELIREADAAGQNLQDSLDRRQKNLDRTLTELEAIEAKNSKALHQSEEFIRSVDSAVSRAKSDLREIAQTAQQIIQKTQNEVRYVQQESTRMTQPAAPRSQSQRIEVREEEESTFSPIALNSVVEELPEPPSFSKPAARTNTTEALRSKIEKQTIEEEIDADLSEVHRLATELLKAGRDVEYVAARTKLPVEAIYNLGARAQESAPAERLTRDPRLGALGAMRRVTQTL